MFMAKAFGTRIIPYNKLLEAPFMGEDFLGKYLGGEKLDQYVTHTIHGTGIFTYMWLIFYGKCR